MKNNFYFVMFIVLIHSYVISQDISRTIYSLLNFHSHEIIRPSDLFTQTSNITSSFLYNDYYRKFINNQKTIDWYGNSWQISSWNSWFVDKLNYGLKTNIQLSDYDYQNIQDEKAVRIQNHRDFNYVDFQIALSNGNYLIGGGGVYRKTKSNSPLTIMEFPSSDMLFNDYFLDYLEPTFGENLNIDVNSRLQNPLVFVSFPVSKQYNITMLYNHLYQRHNIDIHYINSSNIDKLTGNRSIEIPTKLKHNFIQAMLSKKSSSIQSSATYFNTDLKLPFNNIIPFNNADSLDLDALGYIDGAHWGGSIELIYSRNNYQLLMKLGLGNLSGTVDLETPVLGRTLFIPIIHGIAGEITGKNSSQNISFNYNKLFKNMKFELFSSYSHGYYDLLIDGDAKLIFGLISLPVYSTLNYHVHFFDFLGNVKQQIGNMNIIFSFGQIIPIIWRTDSSPIKFKYEPTPTETEPTPTETEDINFWEWDYISENLTKHRGGKSYSISIQYSW